MPARKKSSDRCEQLYQKGLLMNRKKESLGEEKLKMPPIAPNATSAKLVYKKFVKEFNEVV